MKVNCDICLKSVSIQPTANYKINKDGLLIICKKCWQDRGWVRNRYSGQIQFGYYLATN